MLTNGCDQTEKKKTLLKKQPRIVLGKGGEQANPQRSTEGAFTVLNTTKAPVSPHFAAGQSDPSAVSTEPLLPPPTLYQPLNPRREHTNAAFRTQNAAFRTQKCHL